MRKTTISLILIFFSGLSSLQAQTRVIKGTVISSEDKIPIPGVTVIVKGTSIGTTTNTKGKYKLTISRSAKILEFYYVGMKSQEVEIGTSSTIDMIMEPEKIERIEDVTTAFGILRDSRTLPYSVQSVSANDLLKSGQNDVINSLHGKFTDVQITNSAGVAGAAPYIQIRGVHSLTGNNTPLFVVDGIPVESETSSTGAGGGVNNVDGVAQGNRAMDLNPDDIESISILKGGAATALYGLRAGAGAIIITSKKGHPVSGKNVSITFNSSVRFDKVSQMALRQNAYSQGSGGKWRSGDTLSWGARIDTGAYNPTSITPISPYWRGFDMGGAIISNKDPLSTGGIIETFNPYKIFQTGVTTNNSVSLTGGTDESGYYFSFSDNQQKGIVPNNTYRRNTFKISGETKLGDKIKISGSANYIIASANRIQQGINASGVMLGLLTTPPTFDNSAGYLNPDPVSHPGLLQRSYLHGVGYDNPYWTANMNSYKDKVNRLISSFETNYYLYEWISFTYRIGIDYFSAKINDQLAKGSNRQPSGWSRESSSKNKDFNQDVFLTVIKDFAKDINIQFTFGNNIYSSHYYGLNTSANGLIIPEYYNLNNSTSTMINSATQEFRTAGFYGDLQLSWRNMVYLSVTGRNDWSTTLAERKNSFFNPSVGAGFIFTRLKGLRNSKVLPFGKIRFSYAIVAQNAAPYNTTTAAYIPAQNADNGVNGMTWPFRGITESQYGTYIINNVQYQQTGNHSLQPEKTQSIEFGADLKFFQNRISLAYTYFTEHSKDLILPIPVATSTGFSQIILNSGSMMTHGHEITLDISAIKSANWEWDIEVNFSAIKNKVTKIAPGINNFFLGGFSDPQISAIVGHSYRSIFGYDWMRNENGEIIIDDNKLIDGQSNPNYGFPVQDPKMKSLGNVDPDWIMGLCSTVRWKDLTLYLLFDIKSGGKMWNGTRGVMDYFGTSAGTLNRDENYVFDGVLASNGQANNIQVKLDQKWRNGAGSGLSGPSTDYVENSSWIRLRTITLSYSFTKLLKETFLKHLEIYFTGTNLWLQTPYKGIDPETNLLGTSNAQGIDFFNMPGTRSYTLGLTLGF